MRADGETGSGAVEVVEVEGPGVAAAMNLAVRREAIWVVRRQFRLDWQGIHGVLHWARVR